MSASNVFSGACFYGKKKADDCDTSSQKNREFTMFNLKYNPVHCADWLSIRARLSRREKEYKKWPAPTSYQPKLGGPSSYWKIFRSQKDAFSFAKSTSSDLHVFSCESESFYDKHGQRLFLVTSYDQFWHYYKQLGNTQRHHYEVIPEGSVCHLYFDLEFSKAQNPHKGGEEMVEIFIKYINSQLEKIFHITCTRDQILQLDSSTAEKFSQHLVYHLQGAVFQNNIHAGYFVRVACDKLMDLLSQSHGDEEDTHHKKARTSETITEGFNGHQVYTAEEDGLSLCGLSIEDLRKLIVKDKNGHNVLFCDQGVYTRNRNFRLFLSCKLGKNNPLLVAKDNKYSVGIPSGSSQSREEQIFLDSLITNIKYYPELRVLSMKEQQKVKRKPTTSDKKNVEELFDGSQTSPYPELDAFITSLLSQGGTQGYIRRWTYFSMGELMVYEIAKNRWCDNIRRQHRSNNVIYIADIRRGVYYQKCHDPECKAANYKSQEHPLPKEVLPAVYFEDGENVLGDFFDLDEIPDADLLLAAIQVEKTSNNNHCNTRKPSAADSAFDDSENDDDLLEAVELVEMTS